MTAQPNGRPAVNPVARWILQAAAMGERDSVRHHRGVAADSGLGVRNTFYNIGWRVVACNALRGWDWNDCVAATGAAADEPRLVRSDADIDDPGSIAAAAKADRGGRVRCARRVVHNAGIAALGSTEEMPF
jgi:hypothetical protein